MRSVMAHSFSQAPTADIPRSSFNRSHGYKTTFDAGDLVPIFWDEVVPGDTMTLNPTLFARINTPIYPIMDNLFMDFHCFFVPYRQIWNNFRRFMGEQTAPGDSTDFLVPQIVAPVGGYANGTVYDYLGLPTLVGPYSHSALPLRAYRHIYHEWYRDQNLVTVGTPYLNDGPDPYGYYQALHKRGKRHDYFTSCLPWLQKGESVKVPLGETAPIVGIGMDAITTWNNTTANVRQSDGSTVTYTNGENYNDIKVAQSTDNPGYPAIFADLTAATASTVNALRQAFQIQKLLERDARSGTRYSEIVNAHFGVKFQDVTYRPEFLGGTSVPVNITQIPQTSESNTTPQGSLAAFGTANLSGGGFTKSFTEHGIVMGIVSVRADLTYQQGMSREWSRQTRYDFYWPALAHIGEQAVLNKEIYTQASTVDTGGTGTPDNERVFGYQERWAEMRYKPSRITGKLRSNDPQSLDAWHLSQEFGSLPELNSVFIQENPPMDRVVAVPSEPDFLLDCYFNYQCARPMPLFSVPGLIDHF